MRFFTLRLLLCGALLSLGFRVKAQSGEQVKHTTLTWQSYAHLDMPNGSVRRVPTFMGAVYQPGEILGSYTINLAGTVESGALRNTVYEALPEADSRLFSSGELPADVPVKVRTGTTRRQPVSFVTLQPLRRNSRTGQAEKLVSFDYAYTLATVARRPTTRTYTSTSVLNTGDWYKIGVPTNGIYKLDKNFLKALGIDVQSIDPRRLQVYGNATGLLPQLNSDPRPDDLVENAIYVSSGNNSTFGDNDYALFYARGPHTWTRDGTSQRFQHIEHIYTDTAYYFVRVSTNLGKRVATGATLTGSSATISTFAERQFYERDLNNLLRSGRQWLGETFDTSTPQREFTFSIPDLVTTVPVQVQSSVAANSPVGTSTTFRTAINGVAMNNAQNIPAAYSSYFPEAANTSVVNFSTTLTGNPTEVRVALTYDASGASNSTTAKGYLDYLEVNAQRRLRMSDKLLEFRSFDNISANARSQFVLSDATDAVIWDVTNPHIPVQQPLAINGSTSSFVAATNVLREFVAFKGNDFPSPRAFGRVPNQNLHALNTDGKLDLVIVCYPPFKEEAERLAQHRRDHDKLNVQVVTTSQVYNEFSSGGQDVTAIRDLMKMVYDRAAVGKQNYLLLFGDASFDYKADPSNDLTKAPAWWTDRHWGNPQGSTTTQNLDKINQNYVPVYESRESFAPIFSRLTGSGGNSYSSDDYFGFLDENEGYWREDIEETETIDIGIGRLPVRTPPGQPGSTALVRDVVDKLIAYDSPDGYGKWRNRITFVADDGEVDFHMMKSSEPFANSLLTVHPSYNVRKVYLAMYPQTISAAGQLSPDCNQAIDEAIEQGSLIINYNGHGGPESWAEERIFTKGSIARLQNTQRLSFFVTATCDFSTYDNPENTSAGEQLLTDTKAGAIALLTTTRLATTTANLSLNTAFYNEVFKPSADGSMPRLGEVVAETKNNSTSATINRHFSLLGDPTTRLAYPEQTVTISSINGQPVSSGTTLKSLDKVELKGQVLRGGVVNTNFTGTSQITVYEKPSIIKTLVNEPGDTTANIAIQENIIYDGQASVRNGQFALSFVVPKDINYSLGNGKISLYAADVTNRVDAHGSSVVPIGGANSTAQADSLPPRIRLFMDSESFVFGGLTSPNTTLLARLRDENGINTASSGVGHEITAVLDNDLSKLTILNDYYTSEVDSFQAGTVKYLFKELNTGPHMLRLKAWDTHNNSSEKEIEFIVASSEKLALSHVLNYPNPFSSSTTFHFDQNRSGDDLEVQVQIFTVSGKLVRTLRTSVAGSSSHLSALSWDGRDEYNDQLARGVYVYRVSVRSLTFKGSTASKYEKLVILN
ncbi:type IX secretion system sortase PorU [Hymenobacter sp. GOD-10R]|uniref:type IX secretion system sortase PorU n=1 Tax=Hymenobacter sp. GOD-10R TaxID=3093922 RepID=UPI002D79BFDD|nr:type IX secretion system sortase PorU [Hymenobacter sp. GOD-10R]WRQ28075.1 type IX secretion system sortase PorU [Hymenobacter sp. GOD-10R]